MKLTTLTVLATLTLSGALSAQEIKIPVVNRPAVLEEGLEKILTPAQIAEILPWAKDSKVFLIDLANNVEGLSSTDKLERLIEGVKQVVGESAPKNRELLMRYVLNRGLAVNDILNREMNSTAVGTIDAKLRVLNLSIEMAIKYYNADMKTLSGKGNASLAEFGKDYFQFLNDLNKSVFDASAEYVIQRTALEWLQWDYYRDLNNTKYAAQIVKINNALKVFPEVKLSDIKSIAYVRQMKKIGGQLDIKAINTDLLSSKIIVNDDGSVSIIEPRFLSAEGNLRFYSDEGVCKLFGQSEYIPNSHVFEDGPNNEKLIKLDSEGKFSEYRNGNSRNALKSLMCLSPNTLEKLSINYNKKIDNSDGSVLIIEPRFLSAEGNLRFFSIDGVCKLFGQSKYITNSSVFEGVSNSEKLIRLDSEGNFSDYSNGRFHNALKSLICK